MLSGSAYATWFFFLSCDETTTVTNLVSQKKSNQRINATVVNHKWKRKRQEESRNQVIQNQIIEPMIRHNDFGVLE